MATAQVPGYVAANHDTLHLNCWAERETPAGKRLLFIDKLDGGLVEFTEHNLAAMKQRSGMATIGVFNRTFSNAGWTWHDKSAKPELPAAPPMTIDAMAEPVEEPFTLEHARAE